MQGKRAAIYVRVSTQGQEETGTSLESQETACRTHVAERGWSVDDAHVYREVFTGSELWDRPQLTAMRDAVRHNEVGVVVAYAIDRLSRNPIHLGVVLTEAEHHDVSIEFVSEPLDSSPEGQLIQYVRGYAAQIEHMKIRERSIRGKRTRVQSGKLHGHSHELYGYRRNEDKTKRLIHEAEAVVVRSIYVAVTEGVSVRGIAAMLNERGILPPSSAKGERSKSDAPRWGKTQIHRMIQNPAYKGETILWKHRSEKAAGGKRTYAVRPEEEWVRLSDDVTPAIVSLELWDLANQRVTANTGVSTRNESRPYLLRGMIVCGVCGRRMFACPERGQRMYRCSSRDTASGACGGSRVRGDDVETWVWEQVDRVLRDPSIIAAEIDRRRRDGPDEGQLANRVAAERALAKLGRDQEKLVRRLTSEDASDAIWELVKREVDRLEGEKRVMAEAIAAIDTRIADQSLAVDQLDALYAYCERVAANLTTFDFDDKRLALEALDIKVHGNGSDWSIEGRVPVGANVGALSLSY